VTDGFRHLGDRPRVEGWRISLVEAQFVAPDGEHFSRDVVRHPGAVAVVPMTAHRSVLLVRQYRGSIDRALLEIPAGTRDVDGEAPEVTAQRELEEEVGVRAGAIRPLATVVNSPGFCDQQTIVFLAWQLEPAVASRHGAEERFIEVVDVPVAELDELLAAGEIVDAQTLIGLLLARPHLDDGAPLPGAVRPGPGEHRP
jgi:ADP-ribose pyrophosphatase